MMRLQMRQWMRVVGWCAIVVLCAATARADLRESLHSGKLDMQSAGPLAFGPEGILFAADPWGAAIYAVDTSDRGPRGSAKDLKIPGFDAKVGALLGAPAAEVLIVDLAVNPASGNAYASISRGRGPDAKPAIVKVDHDGKLSLLDLQKAPFSRAELSDAPATDAVGRGDSKLRTESITDIAFLEGRVLVAGLSNEEFASTFRSIGFPFKAADKGASIEIYHGAHGRFETRSPVRTFVPFNIAGEPHLLAAYTCTPLVKFPIKEIVPGVHVKGTTVAELGNRNRPLDMIVYEKDGKEFLLLANSDRGVMKISTDGIDRAEPILAHVTDGKTKGQTYETLKEWTGVHQLDRLDDTHAVVVRKDDAGAFNLESFLLP